MTANVPPLARHPASVAGALALALAACSPAGEADPLSLARGGEGEPAVFLTQNAAPDAHMEALYEGPVVRDASGCLRLRLADRHTVVWPVGFRLVETGGALRVLDDGGREVGRLGGTFRLGGGEVPFLHDGLPVSSATREEAVASCPGRYWIVGEVLTD